MSIYIMENTTFNINLEQEIYNLKKNMKDLEQNILKIENIIQF